MTTVWHSDRLDCVKNVDLPFFVVSDYRVGVHRWGMLGQLGQFGVVTSSAGGFLFSATLVSVVTALQVLGPGMLLELPVIDVVALTDTESQTKIPH